jgi:putative ABC transport system permease protein
MAGVADVGIDGRVLIFTLAASLLTGVVVGLVPALSAARANLSEPIKGGVGSRAVGDGARRVRSLLVVSEVALALVLLIGSGLMLKSFYRLLTTDTGMRPERVVTMSVSLPRATYQNYVTWADFYERALAALRATPGVTAAGAINDLPLGGESAIGLQVQVAGRPASDRERSLGAQRSLITPGYLAALGIPVVRGRDFTAADDAGAPKVILINQALARSLFPNDNPLGQQLNVAGNTLTIVGVVGDVRGRRMDRPAAPQMFMASAQLPSRYMSLVVRTAADPTRVVGALRAAIHSVDAALPVYNVRTMQEVVSQSVAPRRSDTLLLGLFAALALVLATLGIYGVMAYTVARRTHEIGIRMALGAELGDVMGMVLRHGLGLTLTGVVIGIAGALALTRVLSSLLFEVSATDPLTFVGVTVLLVAVAVIASYLPARRAARVNPVIAMRVD